MGIDVQFYTKGVQTMAATTEVNLSPETGMLAAERQLVVFTLGAERYGAEIETVREIIMMQRVTWVPGAPSYMEGIINLRGRVAPVIDLKRRLGLPQTAQGDDAQRRIMVVEVGGSMVGCVVDSVNEVMTVQASALVSPGEVLGSPADYMEAIAKIGDSLVILVNLGDIVASEKGFAI